MQAPDDQDDPIFNCNVFELAGQMLDDADAEPTLPEDFGPYHFLKLIGRGNLGDVWLAEEQGSERRVAVKILRNTSRPDLAANEVKIQAQLEHNYIARLYNYSLRPEGTPWLAMEFVDGKPLTEYCARRNCSVDQRLKIFLAICEGVRYAHVERAIDHGDLKPSNILVKDNGEPKLLDFGLSRRLTQADASSQAPVLGFSPAYAAPEIIRGVSSRFRSDIYSLGVILYELLCGEQPFDASKHSFFEVEALKFGETGPETPSSVARKRAENASATYPISETAWRDLDALCLKAMAYESSQRYSTVDALIEDLDRYFRCEPLVARMPHTHTYRWSKFLRRNRRACLVALLVFLSIAGIITFFTLRLARERDRALAEAARTRRIQQFMLSFMGNGSAPSQDLTLMTVLDRSTASVASLKDDPETQAEIYSTLGSAYDELNDLHKADQLLRLGLEKARTLGDPNIQTARALVQLAMLRGDEAQYSEAERLIHEGREEISRLHLPSHDPLAGQAQVALGKILVQKGSYPEAIAALEPIAQHTPANDEERINLLNCLSFLAVAKQYQGDAAAAESINRHALELNRTVYGNAHPRVAEALANIGTAEATLGRYAEAENLYDQAAAILDAYYGAKNPETIQIKSFAGTMAMRHGNYTKAEDLLRSVLPLQEQEFGNSPNPNIAFTHNALGQLAVARGSLHSAEEEFEISAKINAELYGDLDLKTAQTMSNLADVLVREGQYARAERTVLPAVKAFTLRPLPGNMNVGVAELHLGEALMGQKRYKEAVKPLSDAYDLLKTDPPSFPNKLEDSRRDLARVYEALHEPATAALYRSGPAKPH